MPDDLPYLRFGNPDSLAIPAKKKRSGGMQMPSRKDQWERLGPELKNFQESLERRTLELTETAPGAAAEDVLVFKLAGGVDDLPLHLVCRADAEELESPVRYGLAVTLEVAPNLFNAIYTEVRNKLAVPMDGRP